MSNVVCFPKPFKCPLPADAIPQGKDRHAMVFPWEGKWAMIETDDGGGSYVTGLTKEQAVQGAVELVMQYRGTMCLRNEPPESDVVGVPA